VTDFIKKINKTLIKANDSLGSILTKTAYPIAYSYGFSIGLAKPTIRLVSKSYGKLHVLLPFLSQVDLLRWSKEMINSAGGLYDKAMDANYIKTHIGGPYHRLFDGGHSPIDAWEKVKNASDTDNLTQETIGYVTGIWKDATTPMGMPFFTMDKEGFDKAADAISASTKVEKSWLYDLANWDVFEVFSSALGFLGALFFLQKDDMKKVSEILGSMGILSILSGNILMGIAVIVQTVWAYTVKKKKLDNKESLKGAGMSAITWSIFTVLGLPILVELIIVLVVFKLIKGSPMPGKEWVSSLFNRIGNTA
jgi:hypothetical protein